MGSQGSELDVTISRNPSLSKSSMIAPPDIPTVFSPRAGATSTNRPMSSFDSNAAGRMRNRFGTPSGYSPRVIYARLSNHFASRSEGSWSRYFISGLKLLDGFVHFPLEGPHLGQSVMTANDLLEILLAGLASLRRGQIAFDF